MTVFFCAIVGNLELIWAIFTEAKYRVFINFLCSGHIMPGEMFRLTPGIEKVAVFRFVVVERLFRGDVSPYPPGPH